MKIHQLGGTIEAYHHEGFCQAIPRVSTTFCCVCLVNKVWKLAHTKAYCENWSTHSKDMYQESIHRCIRDILFITPCLGLGSGTVSAGNNINHAVVDVGEDLAMSFEQSCRVLGFPGTQCRVVRQQDIVFRVAKGASDLAQELSHGCFRDLTGHRIIVVGAQAAAIVPGSVPLEFRFLACLPAFDQSEHQKGDYRRH